jgi:tRNA/rRNA methyltransferase
MPQSNLRVVLVSPLYGGNVGSACRAMANMGISDLAVVAPQVPDWREAEIMACHAGDILAKRREMVTLEEAVSDCVAVVGTTARKGLYRQHAKSAREWAPDLAALSERGTVALVFGREDKGLLNEEVALCTHLVQIPTDEGYNSLNLAQAVLLLCYELFLVQGAFEPIQEKSELAPGKLRDQMTRMWRQLLLDIGFMEPEKADHMMAGIQRVFARGALTLDDVNIFMGIARQADWARRHGKP